MAFVIYNEEGTNMQFYMETVHELYIAAREPHSRKSTLLQNDIRLYYSRAAACSLYM
jgi:hypothetical protein